MRSAGYKIAVLDASLQIPKRSLHSRTFDCSFHSCIGGERPVFTGRHILRICQHAEPTLTGVAALSVDGKERAGIEPATIQRFRCGDSNPIPYRPVSHFFLGIV